MSKKYLESTIDEIGRIVIPKEIMEELGLKEKDALTISITGGEIALYPVASKICVICGDHDAERLHDFGNKHLCKGCIVAIDNNELSTDHYGITDVRKIDELRRFILPIAERRTLNLEQGDKVFIYVEDGGMFIKAGVKTCYLCNSEKSVVQVGNYNFCAECLEKISDKTKALS